MSVNVYNIKISAKIPTTDLYHIQTHLSKDEIKKQYQTFLVFRKKFSYTVFKKGNNSKYKSFSFL